MVVLVLTACPAGLRGHLTRWLLEISPGVFVGNVPVRIRDLLWLRVLEMAKDGRALMVHNTQGEQRLEFKVHNHDWQVTDLDGLKLMLRPNDGELRNPMRRGWSNASRRRRARRP
ncbi:MAG: type I-E CRISPR-associated endoribonuclease Cas2e [Arachnia sp.]